MMLLNVNNIEVIYNDVILVLKGMSLSVEEGRIVSLLGANGAGKTTTLKAISGLLNTEEGEVTDGVIEFEGEPIHHLDPEEIVRRGIFQVMEGRRVFEDLNVEENLVAAGHLQRGQLPLTVRQRLFLLHPRNHARLPLLGAENARRALRARLAELLRPLRGSRRGQGLGRAAGNLRIAYFRARDAGHAQECAAVLLRDRRIGELQLAAFVPRSTAGSHGVAGPPVVAIVFI